MRPTILPALLGALLSAYASIAMAAPTAASNASALVCKPYIPYGPNYGEPTGNVEFTGSGIDVFGYPGNPMTTQGDYYSAWTFYVRTCNSSSLALHSYVVPKDCDTDTTNCHSFNYIQVINTKTGHCMTWDSYGQDSDISFAPCDHAPALPNQLFKAKSMTFYQEFDNPGALSPLYRDASGQYGGTWSFVVAPDGKTPLIGDGTDAGQGTVVQGFYIATTRK